MEKTLITISRQFGSGGREIAELLTKKLHCHHFNSKIVEMAAANLHDGVSIDEAIARSYHTPEEAQGNLDKYEGFERMVENNRMYVEQAKVILNVAEQPESAIFLGRCADYILRNRKDVFSFFIYADDDFRAERGKLKYHGMSLKELNRENEKRARYYNYYTGKQWGHCESYDLCINAGRLGNEAATKLIADYARQVMGQANDKSHE